MTKWIKSPKKLSSAGESDASFDSRVRAAVEFLKYRRQAPGAQWLTYHHRPDLHEWHTDLGPNLVSLAMFSSTNSAAGGRMRPATGSQKVCKRQKLCETATPGSEKPRLPIQGL